MACIASPVLYLHGQRVKHWGLKLTNILFVRVLRISNGYTVGLNAYAWLPPLYSMPFYDNFIKYQRSQHRFLPCRYQGQSTKYCKKAIPAVRLGSPTFTGIFQHWAQVTLWQLY